MKEDCHIESELRSGLDIFRYERHYGVPLNILHYCFYPVNSKVATICILFFPSALGRAEPSRQAKVLDFLSAALGIITKIVCDRRPKTGTNNRDRFKRCAMLCNMRLAG